jgi:transcriptional regulator GlxA family with amidase domain
MYNETRSYQFDVFSTNRQFSGFPGRPLVSSQRQPLASWQVRRAEAYIEMHWNESITITRLARATAASARSIFYHFKSSRGQSPMSFVKQVRLKHAREMLESGSINRSVTEIAIDCGFGNLGHFASDYFKRFGERPSETLKRSKYEVAWPRSNLSHIAR